MDIFFTTPASGLPFVELLAVGHTLPRRVGPGGTTGLVFDPELGIIALEHAPALPARVVRTWAGGRWQVGVMAAGRHATLLHVGFRLPGLPEQSMDYLYSAELHRRTSRGHDVRAMVDPALPLTSVLIDDVTGLVAAMRRTCLGARLAGVLRGEFDRQVLHAGEYSPEAERAGVDAVLGGLTCFDRRRCLAWEHSLPEAAED